MKNAYRMMVLGTLVLTFGISNGTLFAKEDGSGWKKDPPFKGEKKDFHKDMREDRKAFMESLKDKTPEERDAAILQHQQEMQAKREAFFEQMHAKQGEALKKKLAANQNLTDAQRTQIFNNFEKQYQDKKQKNTNYSRYFLIFAINIISTGIFRYVSAR